MTIDQFLNFLIVKGPFLVLKFFLVSLLIIHFLFSIVLVRQTRLMLRVVEAKISPFIFAISVTHMLFSWAVLVWAVIFL